MSTIDIVAEVKKNLGITSSYQDDTLTGYIREVKMFLSDAGVDSTLIESGEAIGVITRGVADLWNYGSGDASLSPYFFQRVIQMVSPSSADAPELTDLSNLFANATYDEQVLTFRNLQGEILQSIKLPVGPVEPPEETDPVWESEKDKYLTSEEVSLLIADSIGNISVTDDGDMFFSILRDDLVDGVSRDALIPPTATPKVGDSVLNAAGVMYLVTSVTDTEVRGVRAGISSPYDPRMLKGTRVLKRITSGVKTINFDSDGNSSLSGTAKLLNPPIYASTAVDTIMGNAIITQDLNLYNITSIDMSNANPVNWMYTATFVSSLRFETGSMYYSDAHTGHEEGFDFTEFPFPAPQEPSPSDDSLIITADGDIYYVLDPMSSVLLGTIGGSTSASNNIYYYGQPTEGEDFVDFVEFAKESSQPDIKKGDYIISTDGDIYYMDLEPNTTPFSGIRIGSLSGLLKTAEYEEHVDRDLGAWDYTYNSLADLQSQILTLKASILNKTLGTGTENIANKTYTVTNELGGRVHGYGSKVLGSLGIVVASTGVVSVNSQQIYSNVALISGNAKILEIDVADGDVITSNGMAVLTFTPYQAG